METASFERLSRRTSTTLLFCTSRGPISIRTGTPRISHSLNFQPGVFSLMSTFTRILPFSILSMRVTTSLTVALSASLRQIGTITTWYGATRGGKISPELSPCTIITPPMVRVLSPQLVVAQYLRCPSASRYCISKPFAKFVPRLWLVADCKALPSPIIASIE